MYGISRGCALALALIICSCAGKEPVTEPQQPQSAVPASAGNQMSGALPVPSELRSTANHLAGARRWGSEYDATLPALNVSKDAERVLFEPGTSGALPLAFAVYRFQTELWSDEVLTLRWSSVQPEGGQVWVGLPDFAENHWQWLAIDEQTSHLHEHAPELELSTVNNYRRNYDTDVFVAVMVLYQPVKLLDILLRGTSDEWSHSWQPVNGRAASMTHFDSGGGILVSATNGAEVVAFDVSGELLWAQQLQYGKHTIEVRDLSVSPRGDVLLALGAFDTEPPHSRFSAVVIYDRYGLLQWQMGGATIDFNNLDADASGATVVTGNSYSSEDGWSSFMVMLNEAGHTLWSKHTVNDNESFGVVESQGEKIFASCSLREETGVAVAGLARLQSNGSLEWVTGLDGPETIALQCLAVDADSNIYVGGSEGVKGGDWGFAHHDAILLKYSSAGELLFQRRWDGAPPGFYGDDTEEIYDLEVAANEILALSYDSTYLLQYSPNGVIANCSRLSSGFGAELEIDERGFIYVGDAFGHMSAVTWLQEEVLDEEGGLTEVPVTLEIKDWPLELVVAPFQSVQVGGVIDSPLFMEKLRIAGRIELP